MKNKILVIGIGAVVFWGIIIFQIVPEMPKIAAVLCGLCVLIIIVAIIVRLIIHIRYMQKIESLRKQIRHAWDMDNEQLAAKLIKELESIM